MTSRIAVPRIYKGLDLGEYAEPLRGVQIKVWVNPPRRLHREYWRLVEDSAAIPFLTGRQPWWRRLLGRARRAFGGVDRQLVGWYAGVWSQNGASGFGAEDVVAFAREIVEEDPALWGWLTARTQRMIAEHQEESKKV